ncbi:MAG: glycosyltransferase family 39 protein [Candidatus Eremiobacteraeota bacterium]|nr:glycosyltransferase family 39 protein [Candidatus Eremiobacteraeota bacterium]MBV8500042.1 glycosyltransferase family 39 protein [Candidatus Eremiobacteraeota bacterium]
MQNVKIPLAAALLTLAVHLAGNPHYGFFRDELYFIICGFHPAFGYVDQPPIAPLLAAGSQLFGHSLFLLRTVPAIFAAAGVYVTCLLVIELGGGAFAQILAAVGATFANVLMSFGMKVGPDMVGLWLWPLAALYVLRIVKGGDPRLWLGAGAAIGVSLESKYSVIFFAIALILGLALTPQRRVLGSRWFAAGVALAAAIGLPNFIWQAAHGFPMWELLRNGQNGKNLVASPWLYLFQQLLVTNLFLSPVWIVGVVWLLCNRTARFLGYAYVALTILMIAFHAKFYYAGDAYPILIAAGGVAIEATTRRTTRLQAVVVAYAIVAGLFFLPFSLPVLAEPAMLHYADFVGGALHVKRSTMQTERFRTSALPEDWADMHGWPELAATVARIYRALPPGERAQAAIVASNYGEAAAIDFFGQPYGLPPALSGHNNYWLWGPRGYGGNVVIDVNGDCGRSSAPGLFRTAALAARSDPPWVISYEHNIPIMLCTGIRTPLAALWPKLKNYI